MTFEPDAIKQAERDLAEAVGVPVRYSGDKWQWQIGGDWRDVPSDSAKQFDATAQALSVPVAAAKIRYNPKTKRYHNTDTATGMQPMVSAEVAAYTYDATARANMARQADIDAAKANAAAVVIPTAASDVMPVVDPKATAPRPSAPVVAPTSPATPSDEPASDVSLTSVAAHNMGMASAQKAAGAAKVRRTGNKWQVQSGGDWKTVSADDAATLQTAYTTGAATPPTPPGTNTPPPVAAAPPTPPGGTGTTAAPAPSAGFQAGKIIGGQIRNLAGGLLPAVGAGAAAYAVHRAGSESEGAVRGIVSGAASLIGEAAGAGKKIGMALLDAATSPFGASGRAVSSMASGVVDAAGKATQGAINGIGGVLGTGARLIGSAAGIGLGAVGGAAGAVAGAGAGAVGGMMGLGPGGAMMGAASAVLPGALIGVVAGTMAGAAIASALHAIGDAIGGVLGSIGSALGVLGELGSTAIKGLMDTVKDLADTAEKFGAQMAVISSQTGLSSEQSGAFGLGMKSLGLGGVASAMVSGPNSNPMMAGMSNAVWGLPSQYSPGFMPAIAARFQKMNSGGMVDQMMAQSMVKSVPGMDTPEARRVLMMEPAKIEEQRQFVTGMASGVGLDATSIKKLSDALYMLQNRAASAVDVIKMRLAQELLPYAEQALKWVSDHAADIVGWVKKGISWIIEDLPPMMLKAGAAGMRAASGFMESLAYYVDALADAVPAIALSLDGMLQSLLDFGDRLAGIADSVAGFIDTLRGAPAQPASATAAQPATATTQPAPTNPPPPKAAPFAFDMADARTAIQLKTPPTSYSGFSDVTGRVIGTAIGAAGGGAGAAIVSKGNRYAVGVGTAAGAYKGYKEGEEYDAGGERRQRVMVGVGAAGAAGMLASKVTKDPVAIGLVMVGGYEQGKASFDSPTGQKMRRVAQAGSSVYHAVIGDGKPTTGNAAAPGSYQDRYRAATQPLRDFRFQKFATDKDVAGRLHGAADAIQRGADKLASGADTLDEWGKNYKPMTIEGAKEKAADAQKDVKDLLGQINDHLKWIRENPAVAMTMKQVSNYLVQDETQGFLRGV